MTPARGQSVEFGFRSWRIPQVTPSIECPLEVMDDIRDFAWRELQRSRRGHEVGAVLFGTRRDEAIRIQTWREIACEHTEGPGLSLSPNDRMNLAVQVETARRNPELKDLRPVGLFVARPGGDVSLSSSDQDIYNNFFPEAWQIAFVISPAGDGRAWAAVFGRKSDGTSGISYQSFQLEPLGAAPFGADVASPVARETAREASQTPPRAAQPPTQAPPPPAQAAQTPAEAAQTLAQAAQTLAQAAQTLAQTAQPLLYTAQPLTQAAQPPADAAPPSVQQAAQPVAQAAQQPQDPEEATIPALPEFDFTATAVSEVEPESLPVPNFLEEEKLPAHERWLWVLLILIALVMGAFLLYQRHPPVYSATLGFRASSEDGAVQLVWDPNSAAIRNSERGEIDINDGAKSSQMSLTSDQLQSGKLSYQPQSESVGFVMTVHPANAQPVHESTSLTVAALNVPAKPPEAVPPVSSSADYNELQQQAQRLKEDLAAERARGDQLQNLVRILEDRLGIRADTPTPKPAPKPVMKPRPKKRARVR